MSNINKFLNVPFLKVYTTSKLFNYQQAKKNVDMRVLNKLQYKNTWNFLESLLSAKRIGLNVKNDNEIRQCVYNNKKGVVIPWGIKKGRQFFIFYFS